MSGEKDSFPQKLIFRETIYRLVDGRWVKVEVKEIDSVNIGPDGETDIPAGEEVEDQ